MDETKLRALLARELEPVSAPEQLWLRVEAALNSAGAESTRAARLPRMNAIWVLASAATVFTLAFSYYELRSPRQELTLDLESYIAPVQLANASASGPAIYQAPPHFASVDSGRVHPLFAGYKVAAERMTQIHGEPVKQIVLAVGDSAVALFIVSSKLRLNTGDNAWVEDKMAGMACKRLNCPRVRTFQFPCSAETCVIVCKACSQDSMMALMTQVAERSPELR